MGAGDFFAIFVTILYVMCNHQLKPMKRYITTIIATLVLGAAASAQQTDTTTYNNLAAKVDALEARLAKAEKRANAWEKSKQYFKVTGFTQVAYDWHDDRASVSALAEDNKAQVITGASTFHLRRARLSITGDIYKGKKGAVLDYRLYFDITRVPNNPILDMWVRYRPFKEFGVQIGQFKNPLSIEASIAPNKYDFIDFSYAVSYLAKMGKYDVMGLNMTARDIGFRFIGGFIHRDGYSIINYDLGLLNGTGINTKDNNTSKDVIAVLTIKPMKELMIKTYYQWGEANLATKDNYADYRWTSNGHYVRTHRWGVGAEYNPEKFFLRGEYLAGLTGLLPSEGAYLSGGYKLALPKQAGIFWAGAMVDYFCYDVKDYVDRDTRNADIDMRYSICLGYSPNKHFRVQAAYSFEHFIGQSSHVGYTNRHGNGFKLLCTASF